MGGLSVVSLLVCGGSRESSVCERVVAALVLLLKMYRVVGGVREEREQRSKAIVG